MESRVVLFFVSVWFFLAVVVSEDWMLRLRLRVLQGSNAIDIIEKGLQSTISYPLNELFWMNSINRSRSSNNQINGESEDVFQLRPSFKNKYVLLFHSISYSLLPQYAWISVSRETKLTPSDRLLLHYYHDQIQVIWSQRNDSASVERQVQSE